MFRRSSYVLRRSVSVFLEEPGKAKSFNETLAACKAENSDMASMLSSDFLLIQSKLLKYRVARLGVETRYILKHPFGSFPPPQMLLLHLIALPLLFFVAMCIGRRSCRRLVPAPVVMTEADVRAEEAAAVAAAAAAETGENATKDGEKADEH
ncbi:putative mitochondrial hypothetical protein [Leptomonas pyrrhocoris]|uniref:Uncharacterized protein n=1 Tax=Leptomonas pyrrhocoris TaxID=157538 RepID=A0A0N0DW54_LEPPY|nr:putative mitochondrial hypothetical protein [Leptomonas pyrrhocoris]XP_015659773.1 putative mitochondrial hypothetical protein [Leptomonas pyrrhocoris]XP_015659774.1 putative mitochondrial hypothetical protein [Leptomonas pyrrhocoris]KPA81333.1 putative mitochondrial hypothetical protein [Leptomonas pyrrhocoris]KPA81334.1 putative mitochondrial hypothetical protein [Leptomonas pyrrhocoris]KPA81335.1 putative mitochondrial hypothetical protein [Leptomonas pyrrhocoris]|eukprot:XP_015659772.1 putative mitochondrial hypothetical protein [Leptomonas pyrrhocoris]